MKSLPFYICFVLFCTGSFAFRLDAQDYKIDIQIDRTIDSLLYEGDLSRKTKNYEEAELLYSSSLLLSKDRFGENSLEYAWSNYKMGMLQYRLNELNSSMQSYHKSALLFKRFGPTYELQQAKSYYNAARTSQKMYDFQKCIRFAEKVLVLVEEDDKLYNIAVRLLIISNYELERFRGCSKLIRKALKSPKLEKDIFLLTRLVISEFNANGMEKAKVELARLEHILEENPIAQIGKKFADFFRLATMYKSLDYFDKSKYYYSICEYLTSNIDYSNSVDLNNYLRFRLSYGDFFFATAQYERAEDVYLDLLELRTEYAFSSELYEGLYENLSVLYMHLGNFKKAIYYLNKFYTENNEGSGNQDYSYWANLSTIYTQLDQVALAYTYNLKAMELFLASKDKNVLKKVKILSALAKNSLDLNQLEGAESYLKESFTIMEDSEMNSIYRYLKSIEAEYYLKTGDLEQATSIYELVFTDSLWNINKGYRQFKDNYKNLIDLNIKKGDLQSASKNCLLLADLALDDIRTVFSYLPSDARENYLNNYAYKEIGRLKTLASHIGGADMEVLLFELSNTLKGLQLSKTEETRNYIAEVENPQIRLMQDSLESFENNIKGIYSEENIAVYTLERKIQKAYQEYSLDLLEENSRLELIRRGLKDREALIEFFTFKDYNDTAVEKYAASVLVAGDSTIHTVVLCEKDALEANFTVVDTAEEAAKEAVRGIKIIKRNTFKEVYQLLWAPFSGLLEDVEQVYYSPSGLVNKINLSALQSEKDELLLDRHRMVVLSSSSALINVSEKIEAPETPTSVLIVGGVDYNYGLDTSELNPNGPFWAYLEGTAVEGNFVQKIAKQVTKEVAYLKGADATEQAVLDRLRYNPSPSILHIATHGFYLPSLTDTLTNISYSQASSMDKSCLVFAGANKNWISNVERNWSSVEGISTASELAKLNLRDTELVVLSACESGLGDISDYEGVFGLPRALKIAGASYVIMTLSSISDKEETINFFRTFYSFYLLEEKTVTEAFYATQEYMLANYGINSSWSQFVLYK